MLRRSFTMSLKPGSLPEYRRRHDEPWLELLHAIGAAGVRTFSIFGGGEQLYVYSEVDHRAAWETAWATPVHERWGATMESLLAVSPTGEPVTTELDEIFHYRRP